MACRRVRGSRCSIPEYGISPLGRKLLLTPPQNPQNLHRTGETDSWRAQAKPCVYWDPGERSSDPTGNWPRLAWVSRSLRGRCGSVVACCRVRGTECSSACMGPSERGHHHLHYPYNLAPGQATGREHSPAHQQKIGLKIWAWPLPSEQDPVSLSISVSHQEPSISLLSFSIRGQTGWKLK